MFCYYRVLTWEHCIRIFNSLSFYLQDMSGISEFPTYGKKPIQMFLARIQELVPLLGF